MKSLEQLDEKEVQLLHKTREKLMDRKKEFRNQFYNNIFKQDEKTRAVFRDSFLQIPDFPDSFNKMCDYASNLNEWVPEIKKMGLKHKTYGVKAKFYDYGLIALIDSLKHFLGKDYNEEIDKAWTKVFKYFSHYMILGMKRK